MSILDGMPGFLRFVPIIVGAITVLAQTLGRAIVAEGIENELQLRYLSDLHVTTGQGYLLGKPMEPDGIASLASDERPTRMAADA